MARVYTNLPLPILLFMVLACIGCGGRDRDPGAQGRIGGAVRIDGSSTVYPITEAVAEEFTLQYPGVRVTVGQSGTGGGFAKFLRLETDINDASRPIKPSEVALAAQKGVEYIELPVAYDGIAVVVNPENDWVDCLTVEELRAIWEPGSQVDSWDDVRPGFPARPLVLYGPGTDSGTYDYFTEAITGEEGASRADFTASEDDNVLVQGVQGDPNALGFFGLAYYENNRDRLKLLGLDDGNPGNGDGCIQPTSETVRDGTYQPLARPVFIYVNAAQRQDVAIGRFVEFYLENVGVLAPDVGYVPLSDEAYQHVLRRFKEGITGSLFEGGSQVGVSLDELLRRGNTARQ